MFGSGIYLSDTTLSKDIRGWEKADMECVDSGRSRFDDCEEEI